MPNPYQPPTSDLEAPPLQGRNLVWRIFFVVSSLLTLLSIAIVLTVAEDLEKSWADWVDLVIYVPVTVGLLGFVYHIRILDKTVWQVFTPVFIGWWVFYDIVAPATGLIQYGTPASLDPVPTALTLMFTAPYTYALWIYSFRLNALWRVRKPAL